MPKHLLSGHARFRKEFFREREFIHRLAVEGQKPKALYIGCSDSRVIPELLTGTGLGELFVVRNVGNFVPPKDDSDASVGAAIEFAIDQLQVPDIVVCGHYGCGGIKAARSGFSSSRENSELQQWIGKIHTPEVTQAATVEAAVGENVLTALENLLTYPEVLQGAQAGTLLLHGWIYDITTGHLLVYDEGREGFIDALALG